VTDEPSAPDLEAEAFARVSAFAAADPFLRSLGARCIEGGLGRLTLALTVGPEHLNYQGACHGGVLFTLADAAFGLAANSYGTPGVGIDTHITFQRAARLGDVLVARARESSRSRKVAFYQVEIGTEREPIISTFTGTNYLKTP
jgi:phenylacetic acid degradation protein PaaD